MAFPDISPFRVQVEHRVINSGSQVSSLMAMVPARFVSVSVQSLSSALRLQGAHAENSGDFRDVYISEAPGATVFTPWQLDANQSPGMVANQRPFAFPYLRAKTQSAVTVPTTITFILTRAQAN